MVRVLDSMVDGRWKQAHVAMLGPDGQTIVSKDWVAGWGPTVVHMPRSCLTSQIFDDLKNPTKLRENPDEKPQTKTSQRELRVAVNQAINLSSKSDRGVGQQVGISSGPSPLPLVLLLLLVGF